MLAHLFRFVRQKPKATRDWYALGIAVGFTVLVGGWWMVGVGDRVSTEVIDVETVEGSGVFSSFFDEVSGRFSEATEPLADLVPVDEVGDVTDAPVTSTSTGPLDMEAIFATSTSTTTPTTTPAQRSIRIATTSAATTPPL
jgi:hypothetical protein